MFYTVRAYLVRSEFLKKPLLLQLSYLSLSTTMECMNHKRQEIPPPVWRERILPSLLLINAR
jgi:hypothetical protein